MVVSVIFSIRDMQCVVMLFCSATQHQTPTRWLNHQETLLLPSRFAKVQEKFNPHEFNHCQPSAAASEGENLIDVATPLSWYEFCDGDDHRAKFAVYGTSIIRRRSRKC
jgi:hypothetical protein